MSKKVHLTAAGQPDGRRLRSERSRQAIVDAMLELVNEGNLIPTAQQVSERAGVGIRSVFRHFSDMETLYSVIAEQTAQESRSYFDVGDRGGSLGERIQHAVETHATGYEANRFLIQTTRAQRWRYELLQERYMETQRLLRKDLEVWLPEIRTLSRQDREAVDAVASYEMWERLREIQGCSRKASISIIAGMLEALLADN